MKLASESCNPYCFSLELNSENMTWGRIQQRSCMIFCCFMEMFLEVIFWGNPSWNNRGINVSYTQVPDPFIIHLLAPPATPVGTTTVVLVLTYTEYLLPIPRPLLWISDDDHIIRFNRKTTLRVHGQIIICDNPQNPFHASSDAVPCPRQEKGVVPLPESLHALITDYKISMLKSGRCF